MGGSEKQVALSTQYPASFKLPQGPYFLTTSGAVLQAYRLYDDPQSAFTVGLVQTSDDKFEHISASSSSAQIEAAIPVPSRLYFTASDDKPLSGVRVAVKDIYHVNGVKTGAGSRAYYELYPPKNKSAPSVQKLVDLGAVIIGKVKTSQFANGENPTADWYDINMPRELRTDRMLQDRSTCAVQSSRGRLAVLLFFVCRECSLCSQLRLGRCCHWN